MVLDHFPKDYLKRISTMATENHDKYVATVIITSSICEMSSAKQGLPTIVKLKDESLVYNIPRPGQSANIREMTLKIGMDAVM